MPEPVSLSHENGFLVQRRGFRPAQLEQTPWPIARECHGTGGQHEGSRAGRPFVPSVKINTSATDFAPISQVQMMRFKGETWERFGEIIDAGAGG